MRPPTAADYRDALQSPHTCFADPELRAGEPVNDELGLPLAVSGNFASVFQLTAASGKRYAVRCFVRYAEDQQQRYDAIAAFLASIEASWKVDFSFLADGILIGGKWHPILKMEWIEGEPLDRYISSHLGDGQAIQLLADSFATIVGELQRRGAAHGDLQHGNVLVDRDGRLRLIDYDGIYVPALEGRVGHELGHRNYQHPSRSKQHFGPTIDNFSAWVIYASLLAVAIEPSLWARLNGGEDKLLFSREDFVDPAVGLGLRGLELTGNERLVALAEVVKENLRREPASVDPLRPIAIAAPATRPPQRDGGASTLADEPRAAASYLPTAELVSFSGPVRAAGRLATALVITGPLLCVLGLIGIVTSAVVVAGIVLAGASVLAAPLIYRSTPQLKRRRERERAEAHARAALSALEQAPVPLEHKLRELGDRERTIVLRAQQALVHRQEALTISVQRQEQATQRRLAIIAARRRELVAGGEQQAAQALRAFQEAMYRHELTHCYINAGSIPGVDGVLADALAAHGVESAADFSGVRTVAGGVGFRSHARHVAAAIELPSGRLLQLPGVPVGKAHALERWRLTMRTHVQNRIPTSLPPAAREQIAAALELSLRAIDTEFRNVESHGQTRTAQIRAEHRAQERRATAELQRAQAQLAGERASLATARERAGQAIRAARWAMQRDERALAAYADITFWRFLLARG
ncbi:MAG: AarF/UbiB family protein [Solirubrobacteraceae bacterium]|jgi:hypothetical protein